MDKIVEVILLTYNRPQMVSAWMEIFGKKIVQRNEFCVSIYDSSTNDDTEDIVNAYPQKNISYHRIDPAIRIDEKAMIAVTNSSSKYVWPIGDSRYVDDAFIDLKLKKAIEDDCDIINILDCGSPQNDFRYMTSPGECLTEFWPYISLLGGILYKTSIISCLKNKTTYNEYLNKYNRVDGFSPLGILFDIIDNRKIKIINLCTIIFKLDVPKTQSWLSRYIEVWCDNLVFMVDNLPKEYDQYKHSILKNSWKMQKWDSWIWLLRARTANGLNTNIYKQYVDSINRVTNKKIRIRVISFLPRGLCKFVVYVYDHFYLSVRKTGKSILLKMKQMS